MCSPCKSIEVSIILADKQQRRLDEEEGESARARDALRGEGTPKGERRIEIGAIEKLKEKLKNHKKATTSYDEKRTRWRGERHINDVFCSFAALQSCN